MKWQAQTLVSQLAHVYCAAEIQHFPHHGFRRSAAEVGETCRSLSAVELRRRCPRLQIYSHLLLTGRPSPRPSSWLSSPWSSVHLSRPGNTRRTLVSRRRRARGHLGTAWIQSGTLSSSCRASHSVVVLFYVLQWWLGVRLGGIRLHNAEQRPDGGQRCVHEAEAGFQGEKRSSLCHLSCVTTTKTKP